MKLHDLSQPTPRMLPQKLNPARWRWWHTLTTVLVLLGSLLVFEAPADVAAIAGTIILAEHNALFFRAGLAGLGLLVALGIRGHPWWHTVICLLIVLFATGQITRGVYSPEVNGIPASLFCINVAALLYLIALAVRPSVYEQVETLREQLDEAREREHDVRLAAHETAMHCRRLEQRLRNLGVRVERRPHEVDGPPPCQGEA